MHIRMINKENVQRGYIDGDTKMLKKNRLYEQKKLPGVRNELSRYSVNERFFNRLSIQTLSPKSPDDEYQMEDRFCSK